MLDWIIKYWLEAFFILVTSVMGLLIKKLNSKLNEQNAIKSGVKALIRAELIEQYNKYNERGYCPIYARDLIESLYKEYKNLGGNGTCEQLIGKLRILPTQPHD